MDESKEVVHRPAFSIARIQLNNFIMLWLSILIFLDRDYELWLPSIEVLGYIAGMGATGIVSMLAAWVNMSSAKKSAQEKERDELLKRVECASREYDRWRSEHPMPTFPDPYRDENV